MQNLALAKPHAHALQLLQTLRGWLPRIDGRWFQIVFLSSLLLFGAYARDFALTGAQVASTFAAALLTQLMFQWGLNLPQKAQMGGYLSAFVSSCGICILVRSEAMWVHPLLASLAMASKFVLRAGPAGCKSHILNPANFAAFAAVMWLPSSWLSPGQWGSESLAALWFFALGGVVTQRISRWDVSFTFLAVWGGLLAGRLLWFDYSAEIGLRMWLQMMSNGAVLLFAFFMISDPMTTPQHRVARMVYAAAVAIAAFVWQWVLYKPHGLIVMLFFASWFVPLINMRWPKPRFSWDSPKA